jgi:hypothetical protein
MSDENKDRPAPPRKSLAPQESYGVRPYVEPDQEKLPALPFYERHPEWRPRPLSARRRRWRRAREG